MPVGDVLITRNSSRMLESIVWMLALGSMITWSALPLARALAATWSLKPISRPAVDEGGTHIRLELQRTVQKHYLDYGVYLPLEDIVFKDHVINGNPDLDGIIKKICGNAPVAVWVPLLLRLPYIGERSFEWCWKPSLTN